jgi:hypothetical protein
VSARLTLALLAQLCATRLERANEAGVRRGVKAVLDAAAAGAPLLRRRHASGSAAAAARGWAAGRAPLCVCACVCVQRETMILLMSAHTRQAGSDAWALIMRRPRVVRKSIRRWGTAWV